MMNGWVKHLAGFAFAAMFAGNAAWAQSPAANNAAAEAAVRKADLDWATAASSPDVNAWMAFYTADAIVLLPTEQLASGVGFVRAAVSRFLSLPHFSVVWHPDNVSISASGDVAYVSGAYRRRFSNAKGEPASERGKLVEIWRMQPDGNWKCAVNTWTPDEPVEGPSLPGSIPAHSAVAPPPPVPVVPAASPPEAPTATVPAPSAPPAPAAPAAPAAPTDPETVKYGEKPLHSADAVRQYFKEHLKEPDTVEYGTITEPVKGYTTRITGMVLLSEVKDYGWTVQATINAKNGHGAYAGFKTYTFLFRGEKIVRHVYPAGQNEAD